MISGLGLPPPPSLSASPENASIGVGLVCLLTPGDGCGERTLRQAPVTRGRDRVTQYLGLGGQFLEQWGGLEDKFHPLCLRKGSPLTKAESGPCLFGNVSFQALCSLGPPICFCKSPWVMAGVLLRGHQREARHSERKTNYSIPLERA